MRLLSAFFIAFVLQVGSVPLIHICPQFGVPVSGTGYDTDTWTDYTLGPQAIQAVLNIDARRSFWIGYENGGFAWTNDVAPLLTLTFTMADGRNAGLMCSGRNKPPMRTMPCPSPTRRPTPMRTANTTARTRARRFS